MAYNSVPEMIHAMEALFQHQWSLISHFSLIRVTLAEDPMENSNVTVLRRGCFSLVSTARSTLICS